MPLSLRGSHGRPRASGRMPSAQPAGPGPTVRGPLADGGEGFWLVARYLPYATLACIVPMLEEDVRSAVAWWLTERATAKQAAASFRARASISQ